jgi:hypothetical protein
MPTNDFSALSMPRRASVTQGKVGPREFSAEPLVREHGQEVGMVADEPGALDVP